MKTLIEKVRARLKSEVTGLTDVHVLVHENALPETTDFPCAGLKDGGVNFDGQYFGQVGYRELLLDVVVYVEINAPEAPVMGTGSEQGVLDFSDAVRDALVQFNPTGYQWLDMESESASELLDLEGRAVQKRKLTMRWTEG